MGMIRNVLGLASKSQEIGTAVGNVAEIFLPNATRKMLLEHEAFTAALAQYGVEFQAPHEGWFDRFINGLNRLPRPALAIGTIGLFIYAMSAPEHFSLRMQGLQHVPEPLWWLLGAVVSFYFGAREMFHVRRKTSGVAVGAAPSVAPYADDNPALSEWREGGDGSWR